MNENENTRVSELIKKLGADLTPYIIELRRHFHRHPELSAHEVETSKRICAELDQMGIPYKRVTGIRPKDERDEREEFIGTGIIATIAGTAAGAYSSESGPYRRIALRTDIDALPVTEKTGLDFTSENDGVMHACGHDCHIAMMLGAVRMLNELKNQLKGEVRVIFQPAEEISIGARDMIAAGALDGVDAIYGQHIWSELEDGMLSCEPGRRMANTDWFRIDIEGVSAHGSMPHKGVDAIVIACEIVDAIQVLVSRKISPFEPAVVTVGEIHGGTARNIMAGRAYLTGTVRTWDSKTRALFQDRLERISGKTAHAFGAEIKFSYTAGNPGVVNDEICSEQARQAIKAIVGEEAIGAYEGTLAGEDFAEYIQHIPGVFVFIGTNNPELDCVHPQHSCYYRIDEEMLPKGAMVAAQWAAQMLS